MMLVYTLILLCVSHIVAAFRNISLDDSNPAIVYHGNWLETPYDPTNKGGHHMVTADTNAYATLAFTGTFQGAISHNSLIDRFQASPSTFTHLSGRLE